MESVDIKTKVKRTAACIMYAFRFLNGTLDGISTHDQGNLYIVHYFVSLC